MRVARVFTSITASCPVEWYSSNAFSYGEAMRSGYVRVLSLLSSFVRTIGALAMAGSLGSAPRVCGTSTVMIDLPSADHSKFVTAVASIERVVNARAFPVAASAT